MKVLLCDVRAANVCKDGAAFELEKIGFSLRDLRRGGIDISEIRKIQHPDAEKVVRCALGRINKEANNRL